METIALTIDGRKVVCRPGATILSTAEENGIRIPTLCSHPELKPYGACRVCLVEDESSGRLLASCVTPAAAGMCVLTDTPRIREHRRNIARLMIAEHPESCIVCNKGNRCGLRMIAAGLGVGETGLYPMPNFKPYEEVNPFIVRDLSKCILCGKCIRADHELVAVGAIDYSNRGFDSRPATVHEKPLEDSTCTFCGTCLSVCPTGALSPKHAGFVGTPSSEADTICGFCGVGCSLRLGISGGRVVEVNPSRAGGSVNGSTLCVRGHFAQDFLNSPDRLLQPMAKVPGPGSGAASKFEPVSWEEAIARAASALSDIRREHGAGSIAFIGSSKCTNEENYLFQKIARALFGTNNIVNGGAANGQALIRRIDEKTSGAARISPLAALEKAEAILTVNVDPERWTPVAGYHIKRAARAGTPLIVVDSGPGSLSPFARVFLRPEPDPDAGSAAVLDGITARLIHDARVDTRYIEQRTDGYERFRDRLRETGHGVRGPVPDEMSRAAEILAGRKIALVLGPDLFEREYGESVFNAAFNLALAAGSIGVENAGFFVPAAENNLVGSMDMGSSPDLLPGRLHVSDERATQVFGGLWNAEISGSPGLDLPGVIEAAENGTLKGLYIMGENLVRMLPGAARTEKAMKNLDFIVAQDIIRNRTVNLAHLVLPGAAFAEKDGSFTNMEGRVQTFSRVVPPPGDALPDWKILALIAKRMGCAEHYETVGSIRREILRAVPLYGNPGGAPRDPLKHTDAGTRFAPNDARFSFITSTAPVPGTPDGQYPFTALIGPLRWHSGGGTRTSRSARISSCGRHGEVEICPEDLRALGLKENDRVSLESRFGQIERTCSAAPGMPGGRVFVPQGFHGNDALNLADLERFKHRVSAWRTCRVRIHPAGRAVDG